MYKPRDHSGTHLIISGYVRSFNYFYAINYRSPYLRERKKNVNNKSNNNNRIIIMKHETIYHSGGARVTIATRVICCVSCVSLFNRPGLIIRRMRIRNAVSNVYFCKFTFVYVFIDDLIIAS